MITMLRKTREKKTFEQDTKTRDEGEGHITPGGGYSHTLPIRVCAAQLTGSRF